MINATMSTFLVLVYEDTYLKRPGYFLIKLFTVTGNVDSSIGLIMKSKRLFYEFKKTKF